MHIVHTQNISYYNQISGAYDAILDKDNSNQTVRGRVADRFRKAVPKGAVLDFGGGTGRDLEWLTAHGYHVSFCEPSAGMRGQAISQQKGSSRNTVRFMSGKETDFTLWQKYPPFPYRVDGILANFAVINCIPDIDLLFDNLARTLNPGGHLIALVLRPTWKQQLWSGISRRPVVMKVRYNDYIQRVYVHSRGALLRAAARHFDLSCFESVDGSVFSLLDLTRK